MPDAKIFTRQLPPNPTEKQVADHVRYMQEQIEFKVKPLLLEIASLKTRVEELEGR